MDKQHQQKMKKKNQNIIIKTLKAFYKAFNGIIYPDLPWWRKSFDWKIELRWLKTSDEIAKSILEEGQEIPFDEEE